VLAVAERLSAADVDLRFAGLRDDMVAAWLPHALCLAAVLFRRLLHLILGSRYGGSNVVPAYAFRVA
jgi:hypothetical protein